MVPLPPKPYPLAVPKSGGHVPGWGTGYIEKTVRMCSSTANVRRPPMIRVLVVEEVRTICEIIATVLRSEPDFAVVGCATGLDEAVGHVSGCDVSVVKASMTTDPSVRRVRGLRR